MQNQTKLSDVLSREELRELQSKSNLQAAAILLWNWLLIAAAFALVIVWPNPVSAVFAVLLLAGRQLGLSVIVHDCAHRSMFKNKNVDVLIGQWLCGTPMNIDVQAYREYHLEHHKYAGTDQDPDKWFVQNYPVEPASLKRKFIRDLTGQTGLRDQYRKLQDFKFSRQYPWVLFHIALFALLTASGAPWAYAIWWLAEWFVLPALVRLRQIGEHGVAADRDDKNARLNTGTTLAPWWQKLLVAPNNVHYHLEHHMLATVPSYHLPRLHRLLRQRGYYEGYQCIANGYQDVLRRAVA